jgi:hypothetical protein
MAVWTPPGGLDGELVVHVSDGEPLAVDGANRDSPLLLGNSGKLGNIGGALEFVTRRLLMSHPKLFNFAFGA